MPAKYVVHVALDEGDFAALVDGQTVTLTAKSVWRDEVSVKLILSDIGFERMKAAIAAAEGKPR